MENIKVNVRIYGQEYTIAGEKSEDEIRDIAAYVNDKMRELGRNFTGNGQGTLAVLTAINIADEYFDAQATIKQLEESKQQQEKETEHYLKMWDEAKKNFSTYKENAVKAAEEKRESDDKYKELEERCKEFENSFFDLQMENLQLKTALDKYRKLHEG